MLRNGWLVGVAAVGVVFLSACSSSYPKCDSDDNCKDHNEVCVQGQCKECATDANCKAGFVCKANACTPKPECTDDASCGPGRTCANGKCAAKSCSLDTDCGAGMHCASNMCVANTCASNDDCKTGETCNAGMCGPAVKSASTCDWSPVHFGFNLSSLDAAARAQLDALAPCIKKGNFPKVNLEGNTDDRGTEEYNLQLSIKRAQSVKKYLMDLGVPAKTLNTVGYGKLRPAVQGETEEAWAANRRVDFVYQ